MFQRLTQALTTTLDSLRRKSVLRAEDIQHALREVRIALLEADVALDVVKTFINQIQEKSVGISTLKQVTPAQQVIKIVHDQLVDLLGTEDSPPLQLKGHPAVILLAGLQGSGKTTTAAKLAIYIQNQLKKKPLLVSADIYRPAARDQLAQLAKINHLDYIHPAGTPLEIAQAAFSQAKHNKDDVLIVDTAGRLHVDTDLMQEIQQLQVALSPQEIFLVCDAMMGQDALTVAQAFKDALPLTGIILTRLDGDSRGGAALSMRHATGQPIRFLGTGENADAFEVFYPKRLASRILGMGDIVSLVEKASAAFSEEEAASLSQRMMEGQLDFNDLLSQLKKMTKSGGLRSLIGFLPGASSLMPAIDEQQIKRQIAIIQSMTPKERKNVNLMKGRQRLRIANGSGTSVPQVNTLIKRYEDMQKMVKQLRKMGPKGLQNLMKLAK